MKKLFLAMGVSAALALSGQTAFAATKTLTVASWAGPKHVMNSTFFPYYQKQLESCSGGSLSLKVEYGLAPPPALYDTARDGVADMTWIVHGYTPGKFLTTKLAELPNVPGNSAQISKAYQMTWDKYLNAAGEAKGVQTLAVYVHGPGNINTTKKISSLKDLKGMKLRVGGGVANDIGGSTGCCRCECTCPCRV